MFSRGLVLSRLCHVKILLTTILQCHVCGFPQPFVMSRMTPLADCEAAQSVGPSSSFRRGKKKKTLEGCKQRAKSDFILFIHLFIAGDFAGLTNDAHAIL